MHKIGKMNTTGAPADTAVTVLISVLMYSTKTTNKLNKMLFDRILQVPRLTEVVRRSQCRGVLWLLHIWYMTWYATATTPVPV